MNIKNALEEILEKSKKAIFAALKEAKRKNLLEDEDAVKIHQMTSELSEEIIKKIENSDDRDEIVIATVMSIVEILTDTVKIYMEGNGIELEIPDERDGAPDTMYA